jgi:L-alanine-DL-glutamate epimerase-like enolase superfamily enzyme
MKIRKLESFLLSYPFPQPLRLPYFGGIRTIIKRDAMLIRVTLDSGLVGYGPGAAGEQAQAIIRDVIAPFLEGRSLADPDALRVLFLHGAGAEDRAARVFGAVEIALYDALGKTLGVPVSELLGGRERDRIRLYASAGMYGTPAAYAAEAEGLAQRGFRAYKMRPALGPAQDLEAVRLVRESVGPGVELMIDAHSWWRMGDRSYTFDTVRDLATAMADYDVTWLEEPLPPHDHEAYRRLRELDLLPLASGEHEPSLAGFDDLIYGQCVDYVQMDVTCQGGYAAARHLFQQIARENLCFAFHSWGTALEVMAAAQIGICWPENAVQYVEYPCYTSGSQTGMYPFPLAADILQEALQIQEGDLIVSREPGLGVQVNEEVIRQYPWIPGPWSYFEIESPAQKLAVEADHSIAWTA